MRHAIFMALLATGLAATTTVQTAPAAVPAVSLDAQAQALEDVNAIRKLQRAYGAYVEKGYWSEAADLFATDATLERGGETVTGKAHILEYLVRQGGGHPGPGLPYGQYNRTLELQPVVQVAADGITAHARWHELTTTAQYKISAAWSLGTYENTYIKDGGVWKIKAQHYYGAFKAPYADGWAKAATPAVYAPFQYDAAHSPATASSPEALRLALLRSRDDIQNLQAAYGYYVEQGLWSKAADLFSASARYEYGQQGVYVGRKHIAAALGLLVPGGVRPGVLNEYLVLQPVIDVAPDDRTAKARWRSDYFLTRDGKSWFGEGTYENTYINEHGEWKLQSLHFYPTTLFDYSLGWAQGSVPMEGPSTQLPPDLPTTEVFQSFPQVYVVPYHYRNPVTDAHPAAEPGPSGDAALDALRRRIMRLEDQAAVERLQRVYGYYVDKLQWVQVANLFAPDATLEIGGRGVFVGKPHILAYLEGLDSGPKPGLLMNHEQLEGIVDVAADGHTAHSRWAAFIMAGQKPDANWGDATYENTYVKHNGVWQFKHLHAPFTSYSAVTEGWAKAANPNTRPDSWDPPPDLPPSVVYLSYPNYYVTPYHFANPVTGRPMPPPDPAAGGMEMPGSRAGH